MLLDTLENQNINIDFSLLLIEEVANDLQSISKNKNIQYTAKAYNNTIKLDLVIKLLNEVKNGLEKETQDILKNKGH